MVIVAGHVTVDPEQRESYLAGSVSVVEKARGTAGCLDFAITAGLIDSGRVNVLERWDSQAAVKTFRKSAPRTKQGAAMLSGSVAEYEHRRRTARVRGTHNMIPALDAAWRSVPNAAWSSRRSAGAAIGIGTASPESVSLGLAAR
jgi:quinol monooxygenase YgiN